MSFLDFLLPIGLCENLSFYHLSRFSLDCGVLCMLCLCHLTPECLEGLHEDVALKKCLWHLLIFYLKRHKHHETTVAKKCRKESRMLELNSLGLRIYSRVLLIDIRIQK